MVQAIYLEKDLVQQKKSSRVSQKHLLFIAIAIRWAFP